jgi:hypothetical protein
MFKGFFFGFPANPNLMPTVALNGHFKNTTIMLLTKPPISPIFATLIFTNHVNKSHQFCADRRPN